jgi:hypothetical protein
MTLGLAQHRVALARSAGVDLICTYYSSPFA